VFTPLLFLAPLGHRMKHLEQHYQTITKKKELLKSEEEDEAHDGKSAN